eukprot:CAMPEP_0198197374 /NCGR_PEP_ID=MMETSP1445-20131203/999_1 /TAXON_ID=36898 /ORGANISM="Pyramimonas sp., Strain CCMP2087" /LENGTH=213 /DNA_ID=CAMNT_0043866645 /DNA_START=286 /DNA_END=927 /DNA_ORIENTATION=+
MVRVKEEKSKYSIISRNVTFKKKIGGDEAVFRMRPITPDDDIREEHILNDMSEHSHQMRFFGAKRRHTPKEVYELTHVEYRYDFALACVDQTTDEFVGIARYYSLSHDLKSEAFNTVEVAVLVNDNMAGYGIGTYLLYEIMQMAVLAKKKKAVAEVRRDNRAARKMFKKFEKCVPGFVENMQGDVVEYELPLMPVREGPGLLELSYTYEDVVA